MSFIFTSIINRETASASASETNFEEQSEETRKRKAKASATSRSKSRRRRDTNRASADSVALPRRRESNSSLVPELVPTFQTARPPSPQDMTAPLDMTTAPLDMTTTLSSDDGDDDDDDVEFVAAITGVVRPRPRHSQVDPIDRFMHFVRRGGIIRFIEHIARARARMSPENRGASQETFARLPVSTYSETVNVGKLHVMEDGCIDLTLSPEREEKEEKKSCTICLDEFSPECKVTTLPCFHIFHSKCITQWLQRKAECPICRTPVPK